MNTESNKFKRNRVISHSNPCGSTDQNHDKSSCEICKENENKDDVGETASGKFDWGSTINTGIKGISDVLGAWLKKTPDTVINNTAPKDNTPLYVGIGAGALVLVILILVVLKK